MAFNGSGFGAQKKLPFRQSQGYGPAIQNRASSMGPRSVAAQVGRQVQNVFGPYGRDQQPGSMTQQVRNVRRFGGSLGDLRADRYNAGQGGGSMLDYRGGGNYGFRPRSAFDMRFGGMNAANMTSGIASPAEHQARLEAGQQPMEDYNLDRAIGLNPDMRTMLDKAGLMRPEKYVGNQSAYNFRQSGAYQPMMDRFTGGANDADAALAAKRNANLQDAMQGFATGEGPQTARGKITQREMLAALTRQVRMGKIDPALAAQMVPQAGRAGANDMAAAQAAQAQAEANLQNAQADNVLPLGALAALAGMEGGLGTLPGVGAAVGDILRGSGIGGTESASRPDSVRSPMSVVPEGIDLTTSEGRQQAVDAMMGAGYSESQARDALRRWETEEMRKPKKDWSWFNPFVPNSPPPLRPPQTSPQNGTTPYRPYQI